MRAKKSFGQHFLTNHAYAERIAQSLTGREGYQHVLEVGPGMGMLTQYLLRRPYDLKVVEADEEMVQYLTDHFEELEGRILPGDFLRLRLAEVFDGASFALIGNFPYNISSQILIRLVQHQAYIPELIGMFQKELADRVIAPPGSKVYGAISVLVQAYYRGALLFNVAPGNFNPPPKVRSAVIRLTRDVQLTEDCDADLFRQVVKQAFLMLRKMLRNSLKSFLKGDALLQEPFFQQRPEQLSVADFMWVTQQISSRQNDDM